MLVRLSLRLPQLPLRQVILSSDQSYLIGRAPECDIQLDDSRLSRRHARLCTDGDNWAISDLDSKNGILVDGCRIQHALIKPPAWISLGGVIGQIQSVSKEVLAAERQAAVGRWETTQSMIQALDPELGVTALLRKTLDSMLTLAHLERGFVLLAEEGGQLRLALKKSLNPQSLRSQQFSGSWGAIRLAMQERRSLVYGDASVSETLGNHASIVQGEIRALACVPLCIEEQVHGAVYGDSPRPGKQFTELDVELLDALGNQASLAVSVARIKQGLRDLQGRLSADFDATQELSDVMRRRIHANLPAYVPPPEHESLAEAVLIDSPHEQ